MKWQMGSGLSQMMLKYLQRLIDSMTLSMTRDLTMRPTKEKRPVLMSKTKQAESATIRSVKKRAAPMSVLVCFFKIMATMSVPPLDAPMLKRMADPKAGSAIA